MKDGIEVDIEKRVFLAMATRAFARPSMDLRFMGDGGNNHTEWAWCQPTAMLRGDRRADSGEHARSWRSASLSRGIAAVNCKPCDPLDHLAGHRFHFEHVIPIGTPANSFTMASNGWPTDTEEPGLLGNHAQYVRYNPPSEFLMLHWLLPHCIPEQ